MNESRSAHARSTGTRLVVTVSVVAFLMTACSSGHHIAPSTTAAKKPSGVTATSAATAAMPPTSQSEPPESPFIGLNTYLAGRSGEVTAAVFDARTNSTWQLNPHGAAQDTASIVKVERWRSWVLFLKKPKLPTEGYPNQKPLSCVQ